MDLALPYNLGHYTLTRRLGQGGMGVVYAARDERLGREVALKMIAGLSDEAAVKRFWREARAAAAVTHPNVCQIYEVEEAPEGIFLAMELLAGEPLDARLKQCPCSPVDAVNIALQVLSALGAMHERGLVHRDVKPSNVFLTPHGVKLLDFGLARPISDTTVKIDATSSEQITRPGMMVGTPRYMAPEQIRGLTVDQRADVYAVGTVLFEMLAGRPPFVSENVFDLAQAILNDHPPALQGPPAVIAVDRVIRRALAKDPSTRFPVAEAMAAELRGVAFGDGGADTVSSVRTLLRVVVPPLRLQREDADAAFLSYGLAEAVSGSLAALRDIVVRSPSVAAKWASDSDPRQLAHQADVDVVLSGTLSRMGDQLRVQVQAIEAKSGTVLGATSVRGTMAEIFAFEDELTSGVVGLLTPLRADSSGKTQAVRRDVPASGRAFELFLRGLEIARTLRQGAGGPSLFRAGARRGPCLRAGLGAPRTLPSRHRQVHRGLRRQRSQGRGRLPARPGALAGATGGAPVLHALGVGARTRRCRRGAAAPALQGESQRRAPVRGPGVCMPLRGPDGRVVGRSSGGAAPRSHRADQRRVHPPASRRR